ncbi:unnamed protein product, partial [Rotaria sp. Silwood1]
MYTYVTSSYYSRRDSSALANEISVGFEVALLDSITVPVGSLANGRPSSTNNSRPIGFEFANLGGVSGLFSWGSEERQLTDEFKKNSLLQVKFQPSVISSVSAKTLNEQWNIWSNRASQTPAVVNRTLSPITDLLFDYPPEVRRHLELTINYYLSHGTLPSLQQLRESFDSSQLQSKSTVSEITSIPGLDVVGCGYDIFNLSSKNCLLDLTDNDKNTWIDANNNGRIYKIPDGFFVLSQTDLLTTYGSTVFTNLSELWQSSFYAVEYDSWGFFGFGASHSRREIIEKYRLFYQYRYKLAWTRQQVLLYTLSISSFPTPRLHKTARLALSKLPSSFDHRSIETWKQFFDAYGTHYVIRSDVGGLMLGEDYFESCLIERYNETWIREQLSVRYWFFWSTDETKEQHTLNVDKIFIQNTISTLKLIGGQDFVDVYDKQKWLSTVKNRPQPVSYQLSPIYTLLPEGPQREALEQATMYFRSSAVNESTIYIQRLQNTNFTSPLPKLECSVAQLRKKRAMSTSPLFNLIAARKDLCPIVGYNGKFCPGENNKLSKISVEYNARQLPSILPLPRGVGVAIDITTGKLLLPALEFSKDGNTTWQINDQSFHVPPEVNVTRPFYAVGAADINIRIFQTETEMANVWLRNAEAGYWSGGQFAYSRNISDLYYSYFKDNQATAILQRLETLYILKANKTMMKLNRHAQAAVDSLTAAYDENLYRQFMDAWGTHVTTETEVGVMTEQQIIFKSCILADQNSYVDNILFNLDANLREEFTKSQPCLDYYYYMRRKKILDHRIGGDPALVNDSVAWQRSTVLNPALLKVNQYVPWYDLVGNPQVKANLRLAIERRINKSNTQNREQAIQIQTRRANSRLDAQIVVRKDKNKYGEVQLEICNKTNLYYECEWQNGSNLTLEGSQKCPESLTNSLLAERCNTGKMITACARTPTENGFIIVNEVPVCYERDSKTGAFRAVARRQHSVVTSNTRTGYKSNMVLVTA